MTFSGESNSIKSARARVLVVDDEEDIRNLVSFNLRAAGMDVLAAGDGVAAIERIRTERPDLIILDLMLPEMDGVSVCELIRKLPEAQHTPVIMLTAWATERARLVGLQAGADDYVTKPFSPRELVKRVQSLLAVTALRTQGESKLTVEHLTIDLESCRVTADGCELDLSTEDFRTLTRLFEALIRRLGPSPNPNSRS